MSKLINPYVLAGVLVAVIGAFGFGMRVGRLNEVASKARLEQTLAEIERRTQDAVAKQIAGIEIKHLTIQGRVHEILRTETVYRDCVTGDDVVRLLDSARANRPADAAGDRKLP